MGNRGLWEEPEEPLAGRRRRYAAGEITRAECDRVREDLAA